MQKDKLQLTENQKVEHRLEDWKEKLKKELKTNDLEAKKIHIDYDVIYDPFKEKTDHSKTQKITKFPSLAIGVETQLANDSHSNELLMQLLKYDLRCIKIDGELVQNWETVLKGVFPEIITMMIPFQSKETRARFDSYKSSVSDSSKWRVISNMPDDNEIQCIDYTGYKNLSNGELLRCILFDLANMDDGAVHLHLNVHENLLQLVPFLRALRILIEQKFSQKEITISGKRSLIASGVSDSNQRVIEGSSVAMYCAMSGLDYLFFDPLVELSNLNENRILLNIQNIMDLESLMDKVKDPLSGSYIIDDLTEQYLQVGQ